MVAKTTSELLLNSIFEALGWDEQVDRDPATEIRAIRNNLEEKRQEVEDLKNHQSQQNSETMRRLSTIESLLVRAQSEREELLATLIASEERAGVLAKAMRLRVEKYARLRRAIEQLVANSDDAEPQIFTDLRNLLENIYYSDPAGV